MKSEIPDKTSGATLEQTIFGEYPVRKAVATMAVPTIISHIITVIYNLADTWFIGLTGNSSAVAAISLCLPLYNIMNSCGNTFGVGGCSVIARSLGTGQKKRAQTAFALAIRGAILIAVLFALLLQLYTRPFLLSIGGDASSIDYAVHYARITMVIGSIPTIMSVAFSHLIRSVGRSKVAGFGITLGAVLNLVLDPLLMFVLLPEGNEVLGAAIATFISNTVSMLYFIRYFLRNPIFPFSLRKDEDIKNTLFDVLRCGIPSFFLLTPGQISNFFLNHMIAEMGASAAVAAMGIVRKIDSLAYAINQGITQGMLPIVAYCFSSQKYQRMKSVVVFSSICTLSFSLFCSISSYIFAPWLIRFFIADANTIYYGTRFMRIVCFGVSLYPVTFIIISLFQAIGQSVKPFILSILNKGSVDILLLFIIRSLFGLDYVLWASQISCTLALLVSIIFAVRLFRSLRHDIKDVTV